MSTEGILLFDEHYARIQAMIDAALRDFRPNLAQATGELNPGRYPTPTGNAPGGYTPSAHTHPWSDITGTPTTLAGYGITDAQPLDSDLTAIASLSTTSYGRGFLTQADAAAARSYIGAGTGAGSVTSVDITAPAAGITATGGPITVSGSITLALANDLAALEGLGSTGLAARTATDTWAQRTITGTAGRVSVTNGGGVAGNPTIDIDAGYVGQATITTLGTVGTGTWQGTKIGLAYGGTNADLSATGGAGQYLKQASAGAAVTVGAIPSSDLTYSGLTTGQVLRATGTTAAAFGALDLANSSAVTGILPAANGGTGVNNSTRTLTISTNSGTLDFSAASSTLTIPASGTAALRASAATAGRIGFWSSATDISHDAALAWDNTNKRLGVGTSSPGTLFHLLSESGAVQRFSGYFDSGSVQMAFQRAKGTLASPTTVANSLTLGAITATGYASTAADFLRGALISFEVDGTPTNAGDIPCRIVFYTHAAGASNDAVVGRMSIFNDGNVSIGTTTNSNLLYLSSGTAVALRIDGSGNTATTASAGAQTLPANPVGFLIVNIAGTARKIPYYAT